MFIELNKFNKKAEELESIEDYWLYFLAGSEEINSPPATIKDQWVLKAYETIERFNWSDIEYDAYIRARLLSEAEELTLQENLQKAEAKGEARGEAKRNIEIAKKMLFKNKPVEEVVEFTSLSVKEVEELKNNQV